MWSPMGISGRIRSRAGGGGLVGVDVDDEPGPLQADAVDLDELRRMLRTLVPDTVSDRLGIVAAAGPGALTRNLGHGLCGLGQGS